MKSLFIDQRAWDYVLNSQLTLNLIIMFGLWGGFYRMVIKVKNPILDKVVWFAGFVVIVLVLRFFGMRTIFG
jgi:predicted ABC-type exoprotein transport system permease subunit